MVKARARAKRRRVGLSPEDKAALEYHRSAKKIAERFNLELRGSDHKAGTMTVVHWSSLTPFTLPVQFLDSFYPKWC